MRISRGLSLKFILIVIWELKDVRLYVHHAGENNQDRHSFISVNNFIGWNYTLQGCKRDVEVRDRDETETETLIGRDRDLFRDLGTLSFISEVFLPCISFSSKLTFKNSEVCRAVS